MTPREIKIVCGAAAIGLTVAVGGYVAGRASVPKIVDRSSEVSSLSAEVARLTGIVSEQEKKLAAKKTGSRTVKETFAPCPPGSAPILSSRETTDTVIDESSSSQRDLLGVWSLDHLGASQTAAKTHERIEASQPGWRLGVGAEWSGVHEKPDAYRIEVDRRVIGPLWLGARASTDKTAGAVISLEW